MAFLEKFQFRKKMVVQIKGSEILYTARVSKLSYSRVRMI